MRRRLDHPLRLAPAYSDAEEQDGGLTTNLPHQQNCAGEARPPARVCCCVRHCHKTATDAGLTCNLLQVFGEEPNG
jgi:hypothetical protein